ncbi:MAG: DUF3805 domain-containing protein [Mediterranea sp.]|nr:DUF3805 domain-containing protein [Mediterranea sp.]
MLNKKFISPGAWFEMRYPAEWAEFEGGEDSFLFYDPDVWTGNFRISAFKGGRDFGLESVRRELRENPSATPVEVGHLECAYSKEMFEEGGEYYTSHLWVAGMGHIAFECSFTVPKGGSVEEAKAVIASLAIREEGKKYPAELIPIRLSEIYQINEGYEWASELVKRELKRDFQGQEEDLESLQRMVDSGKIGPKKREEWLAMGLTLCVILTNEVEGMEWRTLIDGNREAPVLLYKGETIDPMKLVWSKVKAGEHPDLAQAYRETLITG